MVTCSSSLSGQAGFTISDGPVLVFLIRELSTKHLETPFVLALNV